MLPLWAARQLYEQRRRLSLAVGLLLFAVDSQPLLGFVQVLVLEALDFLPLLKLAPVPVLTAVRFERLIAQLCQNPALSGCERIFAQKSDLH